MMSRMSRTGSDRRSEPWTDIPRQAVAAAELPCPVLLRVAVLLLFALSSSGLASAAEAEKKEQAIPAWFLEHIEEMTQGSGRWVTDNSSYRSEDEPFDAYGLEWQKGLGGKSLKGRLFSLQKNQEVATFWEFRVFWHPAKLQVVAYQFGSDGTVGIGPMVFLGAHQEKMEQEFFSPDGKSRRVGHKSRLDTKTGQHETKSFDIQADGEWQPRRSYTWRRQP